MAEIKITCPNCFNDKQCFEDKLEIEDFSSYMCFACGFASNSLYVNDSDALKKVRESSTELMREISMYDYDRDIHWFPSILNMGKLGMIYLREQKIIGCGSLQRFVSYHLKNKKGTVYEGNEVHIGYGKCKTIRTI